MREMVVLNPALIELKSKTLQQASNKMELSKKGTDKHGALLKYFQETCKVYRNRLHHYLNNIN
jgi:hypothetical protein